MRLLRWIKLYGPPWGFEIGFDREGLAEVLWEYGEDELAEASLALDDRQLRVVQRLAAWHYEYDREPTEGPKLTLGRVMARAMIEFAEGRARDPKRRRRRTRPPAERYDNR